MTKLTLILIALFAISAWLIMYFVFALSGSGISTRTRIELDPGYDLSAVYHVIEETGLNCVQDPSDTHCTSWRSNEDRSLLVGISTSDRVTRIRITSVPRHLFYFWRYRPSAAHVEIDGALTTAVAPDIRGVHRQIGGNAVANWDTP